MIGMTSTAGNTLPSEGRASSAAGSRILVRLTITEYECPAEEITRILGIAPTATWSRGEPMHPRAKNVHHQNGWSFSPPCDPATGLEEQVTALLDLLAPHTDRFAALPSGVEIDLSCVLYAYTERPAIGFSAQTVRRFAQLGAGIDIDYYDLTPAE
jgi:hypothetical protein